MRLTQQQREAVDHRGHCLVTACPGSGKTRTLIAKLVNTLDEVRGTPRKIACITYTNAAVEEIESRLAVYGQPDDENYCTVSTIHAFCLHEILSRFYWHLPGFDKGFEVAPPDSEKYLELAEQAAQKFNVELTVKMREGLELLSRGLDGSPIFPGGYGLSSDIVEEFLKLLRSSNLVLFTDIVYLSLAILKDAPSIAKSLACRFKWFLIDEFQDTSVLQVELLKVLAAHHKSQFFLVGDPHQSIYRFAGARPDLLPSYSSDLAAQEFSLTGNYRSSSQIVNQSEIVLPRTPEMTAVGDNRGFNSTPRHYQTQGRVDGVLDHFLSALTDLGIPLGSAAILAPNWFSLIDIGIKLREHQVPSIGPGSRPYKRKHLFSGLAEQVCAALTPGGLVQLPRIERELFRLSLEVYGAANYRIFSYEGRRTSSRLIRCGEELRAHHQSAVSWLQVAAREFGEIIHEDGFGSDLLSETLIQSAADIVSEMHERGFVDVNNLHVDDIGLLGRRDSSIRLMTIHASKGLEFDAVAMVDLHEGKIPFWKDDHLSEVVEDGRRLFYVGMTRAKKLLMYFTDQSNHRNRPSRFIHDLNIPVN